MRNVKVFIFFLFFLGYDEVPAQNDAFTTWVLQKANIGKEFSHEWKDGSTTKLTYLGTLKTKKEKVFKIVNSISAYSKTLPGRPVKSWCIIKTINI
ncbi:hypothetical protein [Chitinophaga sp. 212800010-3]|uniref:hypothetical protein n=1 Tax=unclassified Chitinophaga TaxID=2619133 RepID=UPI002E10668C